MNKSESKAVEVEYFDDLGDEECKVVESKVTSLACMQPLPLALEAETRGYNLKGAVSMMLMEIYDCECSWTEPHQTDFFDSPLLFCFFLPMTSLLYSTVYVP